MSQRVTVFFNTIKDCGGPEIVDSLNKIGRFGFCTVVEVNVITKELFDFKEEKL